MSCIGTAGHVDHGKSTLVEALTGIDPDRLAEEKARGMTIDLGFAWLTLPSGREVSIIDVPGHESFIKNMLAGVGGIDAALLVVAADEGVMPQTREHLAILDLLQVRRGVVVLTKCDLVDEEWLELVREEVREQLAPTTLADATILPVSAYTGQGLPELLTELERILDEAEERLDIARPRLPIDRSFILTGFGTIVTGTLLDGNLKVGQEVEILPQGLRTRIRGIQSHKQQIEQAYPGSRTALNLANINKSDLSRGNVVTLPGQLRPTMLCDVRLHLLASAPHPLTHNTHIDFYSGSQEIPARVRLLNTEELLPGQSAWAQLRLSRPAVLARRDRFIVRIPSPSMTIGGGEVVDVQARYHRRFQQALLETLEQLSHGTPEELILAALHTHVGGKQGRSGRSLAMVKGYELQELARQCNLSTDVTQQALETLLTEGRVRRIGKTGTVWYAQGVWDSLVTEAVRVVDDYHERHPLRVGISKEEWRTRLNLSPKLAGEMFALLQTEGYLETMETGTSREQRQLSSTGGGLIRKKDYVPRFTVEQQRQVAVLLQRFREQPFMPPDRAEAESLVGGEVLNALIEQGQLIKLGEGIVFLRESYDQAITRLLYFLREHGTMTVAEARDQLGTTRKYILPLLEHMDIQRLTRRQGDERVLGLAAQRSGNETPAS